MRQSIRAAVAVILFAAAVSAAEPQRAVRNIDFTASIPGALRLQMDMPADQLVIENGPPGVIEVSGTVERAWRRAKDRARAEEIVADAGVRVQMKGSRAVISRNFGPKAKGRSAQGSKTEFRLKLRVPPGMNIQIDQTSGDITVAGIFGDIDVRLNAGEVKVKVPKRSVRELLADVKVGELTTNLGDRIVQKEGIMAGKMHFFNEGTGGVVKVGVLAGDVQIDLTR